MSAFKKLKKSDVITIPYIANKSWSFSGSVDLLSSSSIYFFDGVNYSNSSSFLPSTDYITQNNEYQRLIYNGIKQLYYTNYTNNISTPIEEYMTSSRNPYIESLGYFNNFEQSTYKTFRYFPTGTFSFIPGSPPDICVLSIPQNLFGSKILPTSFILSGSGTLGFFSIDFDLYDDGEGNIYDKLTNSFQGNIIYSHGIIVLSQYPSTAINVMINDNIKKLSFTNEHIVYENEIRCLIREDEMNYTLNPSISINSSGSLRDFATGSSFTPYITTVGLYNDQNELLAIGKMAQPVPMSKTTDMTFIIKYDT